MPFTAPDFSFFFKMQFLSSKIVSPRLLRYYSASIAKNLWIKHNGGPSTQVPAKDCINVDDFAEKVKQKLSTNFQVALYSSILEKEPIKPWLKMDDLLKMEGLKNNSGESPLFVKLIPVTQDSIASKTIYIRDIDEECRPLDSFTEVLVQSDADMKEIYERKGSALYLITEPKKRLTKFNQLKDGGKYGVFSLYEQSFSEEVRWKQIEDKAMEEEISLAMKKYIDDHFDSNVIEMPTEVKRSNKMVMQEWDAAFKVDDVLYLCEAKHHMSIDKVLKIPDRIKQFIEKFQPHAQKEFSIGIKTIVGAACGTYFPLPARKEAEKHGLICIYPSGWRYKAGKKLPKGFKIKCNK